MNEWLKLGIQLLIGLPLLLLSMFTGFYIIHHPVNGLIGAAIIYVLLKVFTWFNRRTGRNWNQRIAKGIVLVATIVIGPDMSMAVWQKMYELKAINHRQYQELKTLFMEVETINE